MGNSLRCCMACVLPCGAFDYVRIVHLSGHVDEYSRPVTASEVLAANPNHVLTKPCANGVATKIMIVAPDNELKRGSIYFLIPQSSLPKKHKDKKAKKKSSSEPVEAKEISCDGPELREKREEKRRRRRCARVGVWRPRLESIAEEFY